MVRGALVIAVVVSIIVILGSFAAAVLTSQRYTVKPVGTPTGTIKIGCVYVTSGPYAQVSKSIMEGLQLWANDVNKVGINVQGQVYKVQLVCKKVDKPSFANIALAYTNLVKNDKVNYLIGPPANEYTQAAMQVAETSKKLLILTNTFQESLLIPATSGFTSYRYTYMLMTPLYAQVSTVLQGAKYLNKNITQVVVLYENTTTYEGTKITYGEIVARAFQNLLSTSKKFTLVKSMSYMPGENLGALAANIRSERLNPNLIVIAGLDGKSIAELVKDIKAENINTLKYIVVFAPPESLKTLEQAPEAAKGVIYVSQWEPIVQFNPFYAKNLSITWFGTIVPDTFVSEFYNEYGSVPDYYAAIGYEAGLLLQAALEKAGSLDSTVLSDTITNMKLMTFYGIIYFQKSEWSPGGYRGMQQGHQTLLVEYNLVNGHLVKQVVYPASLETVKK